MNNTKLTTYQDGLATLRGNLKNGLPADALAVFDKDAEALQQSYTNILQKKVGEQVADFVLPNAIGQEVHFSDILAKHRVVLVFYRGTWCPYCNLALSQYQQLVPTLKAANTVLVAISPQTPDESLNIKEKNNLNFEVLSDTGNTVARQYTTVFKYGETPLATMQALGFDYDSFYADDARELPVPATFVIEQNGTITFAQSEGGDYRQRTEPTVILEHLKG